MIWCKSFIIIILLIIGADISAQSWNSISLDSMQQLRDIRFVEKGRQNPANFNAIIDPASVKLVDLSYTEITDIPKRLYQFDSLKTLNLSYASIRKIPNLKRLKNLENLYLNGMKIFLENIKTDVIKELKG